MRINSRIGRLFVNSANDRGDRGPQVTTVEQSPAVEGGSEPTGQADLSDYFNRLATNDPDEQADAAKFAAPRSPAAAYAIHQGASDGANLDGGNSRGEGTIDATADGYNWCSDPDEPDDCTTISDIKTTGREGFQLLHRRQIDYRSAEARSWRQVRIGKPCPLVEFVSAYKAASDETLVVNVTVRSRKKVELYYLASARYRDPSGRQATATDSTTAMSALDADSSARVTLMFAKAKPGGVLTVSLADSKNLNEVEAKIKIG